MDSNNHLYIPETIHIGFRNRDDTYTNMLAYVIYTDQKGKLRKEGSWDSWRDKKIEPMDYPNVPTEGFVLNKKSWWLESQTIIYSSIRPKGF